MEDKIISDIAKKKQQYANYVLKLSLTKFLGARVCNVENEHGEMEECVCIPLDRNNLKKNPKGHVSVYLFMTKTFVSNIFGWTHYLKMKLDPNFIKKINELGFDNPFLGNAKSSNYIVYKNSYESKFVKACDYE
jgi:hypothetical protein